MEAKKLLALLAAIAISAGLLLYIPTQQLTIISVSKIEIDPEGGYIKNNKLRGCYWVLTVALDSVNKYVGTVELPNNTEGTFGSDTVYTAKKVEILLTPSKAYLTRAIQQDSKLVAPETYMTSQNKITRDFVWNKDYKADAVWSNHYVWAEDLWHAHSVFTASIKVDGKEVASRTMDTYGGSSTFTVSTDDGTIMIKSLGALAGEWSEPHVGDLLIFNEDYVYDYDTSIQYVEYDSGGTLVAWRTSGENDKIHILRGHNDPYSTYWYGEMRWNDDPSVTSDPDVRGTPAATKVYADGLSLELLNPSNFGGWKSDETTFAWRRRPVTPVILPTQKSEYMWLLGDKGLCLTEYLESKGSPNMGKKGRAVDQVFRGYDSWKIVGNQIFVYAPFSAYQVPVVQIYVPVELADTWVYRPQISDLDITGVGWTGGGTYTEVSTSKTFWVDVKQKSTVKSTGRVLVSASSTKALISPEYNDVTLAPGETKRLQFTLTNTGVDADITGIVTVKTKDLWTGDITDTNTDLSFKLLKQAVGGATTLNVYTYDGENDEPVEGITVYVQADKQYQWVTDQNGYASFDLGSYRGSVTIRTGGTAVYPSTSKTVQVSGGVTEVTIYLTPKEAWVLPWWTWIAAIAAVAAVAGFFLLRRT